MQSLPECPKCKSEYVYQDTDILICPECNYEWWPDQLNEDQLIVKDSNGNVLINGDSITIIKDLKLKGSSQIVKIGTKIKNIQLVEGDHNIECKIGSFGAIKLKSQFVRKA